jgi:hypothetical protein
LKGRGHLRQMPTRVEVSQARQETTALASGVKTVGLVHFFRGETNEARFSMWRRWIHW